MKTEGENDVIVKEIHSRISAETAGQARINAIIVDDLSGQPLYAVDKAKGSAMIRIEGNSAVTTYVLYNGENLIAENPTGIFEVDLKDFDEGYHILRAVAANADSSFETFISLYAFGEYNAAERAQIISIEGTSDSQGNTTLVMKLKYVDGSDISVSDINKFDIFMYSDGHPLSIKQSTNDENGVLVVEFETKYNGRGIRHIRGVVNRKGVSGRDDAFIYYYYGFARNAALTQKGYDSLNNETTTIEVEQSLTIKASGQIYNEDGSVYKGAVKYAFYREDASGWVLVRDYPKGNESGDELTFIPTRPGIYNITVRIKADDAATYEREYSVRYTVLPKSGSTLSGSVSLIAYNCGSLTPTLTLEAGKPYRIVANYDAAENVLYRFTVYNASEQTQYLNCFSPTSEITFVPNKYDTYIITVRVISTGSFGYMDISNSITLVSIPQ